MLDTKALAEVTASIVKEHVASVLAPIMARLEAVEAHQPERCEKGEVRALIAEQVEKITPTLVEKVAEVVPKPRDGVGVAGAIIDRDGELTLTLTDGTTRGLGRVVGHDGAPGEKGEPGRDGIDGKDGADALGFDDMDATYDGGRTITLRFARGDRVKEFSFEVPMVIDRGVYSQGREYSPGDGVTWAGSYWIAQEHTTEKPDTGKGWRLAVKRGRDGKDAERVAR